MAVDKVYGWNKTVINAFSAEDCAIWLYSMANHKNQYRRAKQLVTVGFKLCQTKESNLFNGVLLKVRTEGTQVVRNAIIGRVGGSFGSIAHDIMSGITDHHKEAEAACL